MSKKEEIEQLIKKYSMSNVEHVQLKKIIGNTIAVEEFQKEGAGCIEFQSVEVIKGIEDIDFKITEIKDIDMGYPYIKCRIMYIEGTPNKECLICEWKKDDINEENYKYKAFYYWNGKNWYIFVDN